MGTRNMNNLNTGSSPDMTTLTVPKLHDDSSNWSDYEPQIQIAMEAKCHVPFIFVIVPII